MWLKYLRDDFAHYTDGGRTDWLLRIALITVYGLEIVDFLLNRTKLIHWYSWKENEARARAALPRAQAAAARLQAMYPPFVEASKGGESLTEMFFRMLREGKLNHSPGDGDEIE